MKVIRACFEEKVCNYLKDNMIKGETQRACLVFNHGLGDYVLFLPIFKKLQEIFKQFWDIKIGSMPEKGYKCLCKDAVFISPPYGKYEKDFDVVFNINYVEPSRGEGFISIDTGNELISSDRAMNLSKPELCNELEIGIPNFKWEIENIRAGSKKVKNRVGVHFFGYAWSQDKNVSIEVATKIWNEIIKSGFNPFEIQMIPPNKVGIIEIFDCISRNNSLRYTYPNLRIMIQEISKCEYFIGCDSGPLYLAISVLGKDKCIGLEKNRKISKVLPIDDLTIVDIKDYKDDSIYNIFNEEKN